MRGVGGGGGGVMFCFCFFYVEKEWVSEDKFVIEYL